MSKDRTDIFAKKKISSLAKHQQKLKSNFRSKVGQFNLWNGPLQTNNLGRFELVASEWANLYP